VLDAPWAVATGIRLQGSAAATARRRSDRPAASPAGNLRGWSAAERQKGASL